MMLRENPQRMRDEFRYVQDMGLNTDPPRRQARDRRILRSGRPRGILVMAGWCCCDHWEHWPKWKPQDFDIAEASLRDQIYRLRSHPSLVDVAERQRQSAAARRGAECIWTSRKKLLWPNPVVSSATAKPASVTGDSGVKMTGPYEYVAPSYWLKDKTDATRQCNPGGCGGAYGFNTETSLGPAVPPIESHSRHAAAKITSGPSTISGTFTRAAAHSKTFTSSPTRSTPATARPTSADDYALKSQLQTYEGVRAMYEAYSRNKYASTGVIQWMLNNAWPSMIWHLYDYYLRPGGGYFGAKKAMEPLHPDLWLRRPLHLGGEQPVPGRQGFEAHYQSSSTST